MQNIELAGISQLGCWTFCSLVSGFQAGLRSGQGPNRKSPTRANVFRFAPETGHRGIRSVCPFCARSRSGTPYSITSSARPSSMGGILNPIVRAVLRLTLSRNLVGNSTGRSDVSIHWGSNWGYHIPDEQKILARALIDKAGVSIVHGHSSHHPRAIEIYRDRLILYGCGDFLNDYEGIRGDERYRDDLALMYFADLDPASGSLHALRLVPLQIKNFRLSNPSWRDIEWDEQTLDCEGQQFGTRVILHPERHVGVFV